MTRFLTIDQTCERLGVKRSQFYYMRKPGHKSYQKDLPKGIYPYDDTKMLFNSDEIEAFIKSLIAKCAA